MTNCKSHNLSSLSSHPTPNGSATALSCLNERDPIQVARVPQQSQQPQDLETNLDRFIWLWKFADRVANVSLGFKDGC